VGREPSIYLRTGRRTPSAPPTAGRSTLLLRPWCLRPVDAEPSGYKATPGRRAPAQLATSWPCVLELTGRCMEITRRFVSRLPSRPSGEVEAFGNVGALKRIRAPAAKQNVLALLASDGYGSGRSHSQGDSHDRMHERGTGWHPRFFPSGTDTDDNYDHVLTPRLIVPLERTTLQADRPSWGPSFEGYDWAPPGPMVREALRHLGMDSSDWHW